MPANDSPAKPHVVSLLTADVVHRDGPNGKFSLLGIFNAITAAEFPAGRPSLGVYLALAGVTGRAEFVVRLVEADGQVAPIVSATLTVDVANPAVVAEFGFDLPGIQFAKAGQYRLQVVVGSDVLAERRLDVVATGAVSVPVL